MKTTKDINARNKELFIQMQNGDEHAREKIFKLNARLVTFIIKKFYKPSWTYTFEDCHEAGQYGLLKAIDSFDPEKAAIFATYAARCIENEVFLLYRKSRKFEKIVSLDAPLKRPKDGSSEDVSSFADLIADKYDIQEHIEAREKLKQIEYVARCVLTPLEQKVFSLSFLREDKQTQDEVALKLGISRSYVANMAIKATSIVVRAIYEEPKFKGGIRKVVDGTTFWLPTKEMFVQMMNGAGRNNRVVKANVELLLKNDKNRDIDHDYDCYCRFLTGEISFNGVETRVQTTKHKFSSRLQTDQDFRAFAKQYISVNPTKGFKILELRQFTSPPLSYDEISKELGIEKNTAYLSHHQALKTLQAEYEQHLSGQAKPTIKGTKRKNEKFVERLQHDTDVQAFVKSYLPKMQPRLAKIFSLKYLTNPEPTNREIAERLNIKEHTALTQLSCALKEMRAAYESQQE